MFTLLYIRYFYLYNNLFIEYEIIEKARAHEANDDDININIYRWTRKFGNHEKTV